LADGRSAVIVSSALKETYRKHLTVDPAQTKFVYLKGSYDLIMARMQARPGHFMKPEMLDSQFATLEEPHDAINVDIASPPERSDGRDYSKVGSLLNNMEYRFLGGSGFSVPVLAFGNRHLWRQ